MARSTPAGTLTRAPFTSIVTAPLPVDGTRAIFTNCAGAGRAAFAAGGLFSTRHAQYRNVPSANPRPSLNAPAVCPLLRHASTRFFHSAPFAMPETMARSDHDATSWVTHRIPIFRAATSEAAKNEGYFVDDGRVVTWGEFQKAIVDASGRRTLTLRLPEALVSVAAIGGEMASRIDGKPRLFNRQKAKMGAQEAWTCKSDALRKDTGWAPSVPMEEGVRRAYEWYRAEKWL